MNHRLRGEGTKLQHVGIHAGIVLVLACVLMVFGMGALQPVAAHAQEFPHFLSAQGDFDADSTGTEKTKYHQLQGTVYVSFSTLVGKDAGRFLTAEDDAGAAKVLWHVPVDLAEVSKIDPADYVTAGNSYLDSYKVKATDPDADYLYETTALHLALYLTETWTPGNTVNFEASVGLPFTRMLGYSRSSFEDPSSPTHSVDSVKEGNFAFLMNGQRVNTWLGADQLIHDGDCIDIMKMHYPAGVGPDVKQGTGKCWHGHLQGIRFFADVDENPLYEDEATEGVPYSLHLMGRATTDTAQLKAGETFDENGNDCISPDILFSHADYLQGFPVHYGRTYGVSEGTVYVHEGRASLTFPDSGTWYVWADGGQTLDGSNYYNTNGTYITRFDHLDTSPTMMRVQVAERKVAPSVGGAMSDARLGGIYRAQIPVSGWPRPSLEVVSGELPPGMSIDDAGIVSGTPESLGTYTFAVRASNGIGDPAVGEVSLSVLGEAPSVLLRDGASGTTRLPSAAKGTRYVAAFQVAGNPAPTVSVVGLPMGLTYNERSKSIVGVPTEGGLFIVEVSASNGANVQGKADAGYIQTTRFALSVTDDPIVIMDAKLPAAHVGEYYDYQLSAAVQSDTPVEWELVDGELPAGLQLSREGVVSGVASDHGWSAFTVKAIDAFGDSATAELNMVSKTKYRQETGSVRFTITYLGNYVTTNGSESETMRYVDLPAEEISQIDLADWTDSKGESLERYNYEAQDPEADYDYELTVLHAFIYASERFTAAGGNSIDISGTPRSTWIAGGGIFSYGAHEGNLLYYVNGRFPIEYLGWGSTSDDTPLYGGDFIDVCTWAKGGIGDASTFGTFRYFTMGDDDNHDPLIRATGEIVHSATIDAGQMLEVRVQEVDGSTGPYYTKIDPLKDQTVNWGVLNQYGKFTKKGSVTSDADGKVQLDFDCVPGQYCVWTNETRNLPAYMQVTVTDGDELPTGRVSTGYLKDYAYAVVGEPFSAQVECVNLEGAAGGWIDVVALPEGKTAQGDIANADAGGLYVAEGSNMPEGLSLAADGTVSGTPRKAGHFEVECVERAKPSVAYNPTTAQWEALWREIPHTVQIDVWDAGIAGFRETKLNPARSQGRYAQQLERLDADQLWIAGVAVSPTVSRISGASDASWLAYMPDLDVLWGTGPLRTGSYSLRLRSAINDYNSIARAWWAGYRDYVAAGVKAGLYSDEEAAKMIEQKGAYAFNPNTGLLRELQTRYGAKMNTFTVTVLPAAADLSDPDAVIVNSGLPVVYDGQTAQPDVYVFAVDGHIVNEGYTKTWVNNEGPGTAELIVVGDGDAVRGIATVAVPIGKGDIAACKIAPIVPQALKGDVCEPSLTLTSTSGVVLRPGIDYVVSYFNSDRLGRGRAVAVGIGNWTGLQDVSYKIVEPIALDAQDASLAFESCRFEGSPVEPAVSVYAADGTELVEGQHYMVSYVDNAAVGAAHAIIEGIDLYTGTIDLEFTILPPEGQDEADAVIALIDALPAQIESAVDAEFVRAAQRAFVALAPAYQALVPAETQAVLKRAVSATEVYEQVGSGSAGDGPGTQPTLTAGVLKVTAKAKTAKKALSGKTAKTVRIAAKKYVKVSAHSGALSYKLVKVPAKIKKRVSINTKTGALTVKKGARKGKYVLRVRITSAPTATSAGTSKAIVVRLRIR